MGEFANVALVNVNAGINGQQVDIDNALLATTYAISKNRALTIDFIDFDNVSGSADVLNLQVSGAGSVSGDAEFDLSGNDIETVSVATSGTNFFDLVGGSDTSTYSFTGSGVNDMEIAAGVSALTVNASATTGTNILNLGNGLFSTNDTVLGGTGLDAFNAFLEAGTTAATISGVEAIGLVVDELNTFFSGINTTGATSIELLDLSDESVNLTALKAQVSTVEISSNDFVNTDNLTINYVSGSNASSRVLVETGASVDFGDITTTSNTGAFQVFVDGDGGVGDVASFDVITANNASAVSVIADQQDVEFNEVVGNAAANFTFSAIGGVSLDDDGAGNEFDVNLNTGSVPGVAINTINFSATGVNASAGGSSVSANILNGGNAPGETSVSAVNIVSDANGSVKLLVQEGTTDALLINDFNATQSAGSLNLVLNFLGNSQGVQVRLGSGSSTVVLTTAADRLTAGSGNSTVTTFDGADTITGSVGVETVVLSTNNDGITLANFSAGSGTGKDIAKFDLSAWGAPVSFNDITITDATAASLDKNTAGAAWTFDSGNILALTGVIANDAALELELQTNGNVNGAIDDGENILVAYYDGFTTQLRTVELTDVAAGGIVDATIVSGGAQIVGVNTTTLANANFGFVA